MAKKKKVVRPYIQDVTVDNSKIKNGVVAGNFIKLNKAGTINVYVIDAASGSENMQVAFEVDETEDAPQKYRWVYKLLSHEPQFSSVDGLPGEAEAAGLNFPELVEGGGLAWIEPFLDEPQNRKPNGYFISAKGEVHKVLTVHWRKATPQNDGQIIDRTTQLLKDNIELHIYTQGLYGQEITVQLLVEAKELNLYETRADSNIPKLDPPDHRDSEEEAAMKWDAIEKQKKEIQEDMEAFKLSRSYFTAQVKARHAIYDEREVFNKDIILGGLAEGKDKKALSIPSTQKAIVTINLDPFWRFLLEKGEHKIYPQITVKSTNRKSIHKDYFIVINGDENPNPESDTIGNNPISISDIAIHPDRFELCKYSKLSIQEDNEPAVKIFAEEELSQTEDPPKILYYGIVTGEKENAKTTVKLLVDGLNKKWSDCHSDPTHENKVVDITHLQNSGYRKETEKYKKPQDKNKKDAVLTASGTFRPIGGFSTSVQNHGKSLSSLIKKSDEDLEFDVTYDYHILKEDGSVDWSVLKSYIWLPDFQADAYRVLTTTCRWQHEVNFVVYPDIKWTIGFKINFFEERFKSFSEKFKEVNNKTTLNPFVRGVDMGNRINARSNARLESAPNKSTINSEATFLSLLSVDKNKEDEKTDGFAKIIEFLDKYEISLKAEWNNGLNKEDVIQALFEVIDNAIAGFKLGVKFIEKIFKNPDAKMVTLTLEKEDFVKKFLKKMKANPITYEVMNPVAAVAVAWFFENVNANRYKYDTTNWGAGVSFAISLDLEPAIGIKATMDLVQMLSRRHPVALAIVAASRAITTLFNQPEMIKVEFVISGQLNLGGNIKYNTNAGFIKSTGKKTKKGHVVKGGAYITLSLEARIHIEAKVEIYYVAEVKAYVDAGLKGSVGIGLEALLNSDDQGMFIEAIGKFDGIKIKGDIKIDLSVKQVGSKAKDENTDSLLEGGFEIVLLDGKHSFFKIRI